MNRGDFALSNLLVDYVTYKIEPKEMRALDVAQLAREVFVYKNYAKMREMRSTVNYIKKIWFTVLE